MALTKVKGSVGEVESVLKPQGIVLADKVITGFDASGLQDGAWVHFAGRDTVGDGGGGYLRYLAGSTDAVNGVTVYSVPTGRLVRDKEATVSVAWAGAKKTSSTTANKSALQLTIAAVDAMGGGFIEVPFGIDYGFKNTDPSSYPNFSGCANDITVIDYGVGDADGSGNKAGAQIRTFHYTKQTTPAGIHDGNGSWLYGDWHPYHSINNTAQLGAPGSPSRLPSDNRRASLLFNNDGKSTWRLGQGTLAGDSYTDEELSNFVLEHYHTSGDTLPNYAPLTIERKTGNWSIGGGTNAPAAMLAVKNVTAGYWTALFESLSTSTEIRLRNSNGISDDVSIKNVSGDFVLNVPSLGDALTVKKSNRNIAIGSNGDYRLDVADSKSNGYVVNAKNNSSTNGNVMILDSSSAPGTGWSPLRVFASNQTDQLFQMRGDGNAYADGSWNGGGADYAEYFEWYDGNPYAEDRRGISVALDGNKVRPAVAGDVVIGVVSSNPSVVGDAAWNAWEGKFVRDDYGTIMTEKIEIVEWDEKLDSGDVVHYRYKMGEVPEDTIIPEFAIRSFMDMPMINPKYDSNEVYIPREFRKEWACIGLVGKLRVRNGQPIDGRWIKMRDISEDVSEYLVR